MSADPAAPKKGMSGAAKILVGCAVLFMVVGVAGAVAIGVGARFVTGKAHEFTGAAERHAEAAETLQQLHTRYPFRPPEDDAVRPERATAFLGATDRAWELARPAWEDLRRRSERADQRGRAAVGDIMAGISGFHELTMAVADALEAHGMSPAEYVWTGVALRRAYEALDQVEAGHEADWIPAANLDLARRHRQQLAHLSTDDERGGLVLAFAMMYGVAGMEDVGWLQHRDYSP